MRIVADNKIAHVETAFASLGDLVLLPGREIGIDAVADADILLIRSVTKVDEKLLQGSKVRFVGTATIGVDHIDTSYLQSNGIVLASAPGCNANAVPANFSRNISGLRTGCRELPAGGKDLPSKSCRRPTNAYRPIPAQL